MCGRPEYAILEPPVRHRDERDRNFFLIFESSLGMSFNIRTQYHESSKENRPMTPEEEKEVKSDS